jgi:hypothetical protein
MRDPKSRRLSATRKHLRSMVSPAICHQRVFTLSNELTFKLVEEFKRELIFCRERLLTNDSLHRGGVSGDRILRILS